MRNILVALVLAVTVAVTAAVAFADTPDPSAPGQYNGPFFQQHMDNQGQ